LNEFLSIHGKSTKDYDLPSLPAAATEENIVPSVIQEELSVHISDEDIQALQN
jgi:hypothetical protein